MSCQEVLALAGSAVQETAWHCPFVWRLDGLPDAALLLCIQPEPGRQIGQANVQSSNKPPASVPSQSSFQVRDQLQQLNYRVHKLCKAIRLSDLRLQEAGSFRSCVCQESMSPLRHSPYHTTAQRTALAYEMHLDDLQHGRHIFRFLSFSVGHSRRLQEYNFCESRSLASSAPRIFSTKTAKF